MGCFKPRFIQLIKPIARTGELLTHVNVPCGKCSECIKRRRMEWCFRMEQEMKDSKTCYFITLTYDPKHVVYDKYGNMILVKTSLDAKRNFRAVRNLPIVKDKYLRKMKMKDLGFEDRSAQGFIKRLRIGQERVKHVTSEAFFNRLMPNDKMKFFLVGEYGERFGRPHIHAIIFNGVKECIWSAWSFGDVQVVKATSETIAYCTKYMDKWRDKKQDWKRPIEFNTQSEAIGISFVERMMNFYRNNLDINYVMNDKGFKVAMPRYYRMKMLNEDELNVQIAIINDEMNSLRDKEIKCLGIEKYNKRKKLAQDYADIKFKRDKGKREM